MILDADLTTGVGLEPERLRVHENGRGLVTAPGRPVFLLADTAWSLAQRHGVPLRPLAGARYGKEPHLVWVLGGDRSAVNGDADSRPVLRAGWPTGRTARTGTTARPTAPGC